MLLIGKLWWYFRLKKWHYGFAMLVLIAVALLNLVPPWLTGRIVDAASNGTLEKHTLLRNTLLILAVGVAIYLLRYLWRVSLYSASYQLSAILRKKLYNHLLLQTPAFYQRFKTGDLMARATNDILAIEMSAGEAVLAVFDGVLTGGAVLSVMFFIDWRLALIALLPWPLMTYLFWRVNDELHDSFFKAQTRFSDLNNHVQSNISSLRLIRAYGMERRVIASFLREVNAALQANLLVSRAEAKYEPIITLTVASAFLLAVSGGAWFISHQQLSVGELTSFTLYLGFLVWPMFAYGWVLNLLERGTASYTRLNEIMQIAPDIADAGKLIPPSAASLSWSISDYRYAQDQPSVLSEFAGELAAGKTLGIVGPTGAGKSTFLQLIMRLSASDNALIQLAGVPIENYSLQALRDHITVVPQEPFMFSLTIGENIALGHPAASQQEIETAAQFACIHDDILRFPQAYNTMVGERGVTLSGGQKQRLAIARALLMKAKIVILDDALSAVDVLTEKKILQNFQQSHIDHSLLIVSHRLTAVEKADQIIVLQQGKPTEFGTHDELIARDGWYAQIYRYQQIEQAVLDGR